MAAIAPVLFDAFPEDARHDREAPYRGCVNTGAPGEAVETMSTPYETPPALFAAMSLGAAGALPLVAGLWFLILNFLHIREHDSLLDLPAWLTPVALSGLALIAVAVAWGSYLASRFHPKAKAWRKTLGDAWAAHGGDITELWTLGVSTRHEVQEYAEKLEDVRKGLNRLDPEGDELDVARYTLQRFIDASNIPPLGAKAAKASHIKDPKVRQAAKEYEGMVKQQGLARQAVEVAAAAAEDLLAARTQARSDAELIKQVHQL